MARAEIIGESETEIELFLALHRKDGSSPRPGDVLLAINNVAIETPEQAARMLAGPGRYAVTVQRGAQRVVLQFRA